MKPTPREWHVWNPWKDHKLFKRVMRRARRREAKRAIVGYQPDCEGPADLSNPPRGGSAVVKP